MPMQRTSTTHEAIAVLKTRLQQGINVDSYMYVEVLKRCSKQRDLVAAKQVHDCIIRSGMDQYTYVANNLLPMCTSDMGDCSMHAEHADCLMNFSGRMLFGWTTMIGGCPQHNHAKDAMEVFNQMRQEGVQPNEVTCLSILKACANLAALKWGKEIHAYIRYGGLESDVRVGTALLKMYAKCGCMEEARRAFDNLTNRNVVSWNMMIGAYELFL